MAFNPKTLFQRLRTYLILLVASVGIAFTLRFMHALEPIQEWMFWRFGLVYGIATIFALACLSAGHAAMGHLVKTDPLPARERLLFDLVAGVLIFATATFLVGLAHGLGAIYFFGLPVAMILLSAKAVIRDIRRVAPRYRRHLQRARQAPALLPALAVGFGAIGLLVLYLPLLTTQNVSFDARWYHLAIAEHYVAAGAIGAFKEGFYLGAYPHLASWLYTWAMALPLVDLHLRILLAAHLEWFLFLATLAGIPLLVERILGGARARGAWALCFLFPGIFLYDSNLIVGADHILAFFAVPLGLSTIRFIRHATPRRGILFAMVMAGAALTKAQSIYLLAPASLAILAVSAYRLWKGEQRRRLLYVLAVPMLGSFLLLTASYWLANLVWHHNPVYPFLGDLFPSQPWRTVLGGLSPDPGFTPEGTFLERVGQTLAAPFTFAYIPHDWETFHHDIPVFGFLFTLSLSFLPFLRGTRRIWILAVATLLGIALWFWTFHQDRYLQALLPWMVAATAAIFILAWKTGWPARIAVAGLVSMQLIVGGDTPFLPTHAMAQGSPIELAVRLLSSTFRKDYNRPRDSHSGFERIHKALPKDSTVLFHLDYIRLGIGRPVVTDNPRWSGAPLLGFFNGPGAAIAHLRSLGVTHLLHPRDNCRYGDLNLRSELAFHALAEREVANRREVDGWKIDELPKAPSADTRFGAVVYLGCGHRGPVPFAELDNTWEADRAKSPSDMNQLSPADAAMFEGAMGVVVDDRCAISFPTGVQDRFTRATHWREATLWIRKREP